jgi:GH25 family lysozyme M1 (1,4-beta-N-acetylmuramidase)
MNGIDISGWQADLNAGTVNADFVIIKATEGKGYINSSCDAQFQQAISAGKCVGVYHFARNSQNSSDAEAQYFYDNVKGYVGQAIFVLDWEDNTADVAWAKRFLDKFAQLSGVPPLIYMSESVVNAHDWSLVANANYGLWVAKYLDYVPDSNYDMTDAGPTPSVNWWQNVAMWQWTSSGKLDGYSGTLDLNRFYGDSEAWRAYAKGEVMGLVDLDTVKKMAQVLGGRINRSGRPNNDGPDLSGHVGTDALKEFSNWYWSQEGVDYRDKWLPTALNVYDKYRDYGPQLEQEVKDRDTTIQQLTDQVKELGGQVQQDQQSQTQDTKLLNQLGAAIIAFWNRIFGKKQ